MKWSYLICHVQVDVVLLKGSKLLVQMWPPARAVEVHPGGDGNLSIATEKSGRTLLAHY